MGASLERAADERLRSLRPISRCHVAEPLPVEAASRHGTAQRLGELLARAKKLVGYRVTFSSVGCDAPLGPRGCVAYEVCSDAAALRARLHVRTAPRAPGPELRRRGRAPDWTA